MTIRSNIFASRASDCLSVSITDCRSPVNQSVPVDEDAPNVVALLERLGWLNDPRCLIVYQDVSGLWHGIRHNTGVFVSLVPLSAKSESEAVEALKGVLDGPRPAVF